MNAEISTGRRLVENKPVDTGFLGGVKYTTQNYKDATRCPREQ